MNTFIKLGLFCSGVFGMFSAHANENFVQNGKEYILKSDQIGVIRKGESKFMRDDKHPQSKHQKSFFDVYDTAKLNENMHLVGRKKQYRVVYRQVLNENTQQVTEVPGLLTGSVIVQAKDINKVKTSLQLKASYPQNGFYIYELPTDQSIAHVLNEFSNQSSVNNVQVEVIEQLRTSM